MVSRIITRTIFIAFFMLINAIAYSQKLPDGFMVIGNDIGKKQLSNKELIEIFKGKYNSWNNKEQTIIVLPSSKHINSEIISKNIFLGNKDVMMKYWLSLVFQGRANPPVFLENDKDIVEYVETTPGSIAIIRYNATLQNSRLHIKIAE
jgi:ABC-type phosphate transport system substrate-binding protein